MNAAFTLLTCFICQDIVHPNRLDHIEFRAKLGWKQRVANVKEPWKKYISQDKQKRWLMNCWQNTVRTSMHEFGRFGVKLLREWCQTQIVPEQRSSSFGRYKSWYMWQGRNAFHMDDTFLRRSTWSTRILALHNVGTNNAPVSVRRTDAHRTLIDELQRHARDIEQFLSVGEGEKTILRVDSKAHSGDWKDDCPYESERQQNDHWRMESLADLSSHRVAASTLSAA